MSSDPAAGRPDPDRDGRLPSKRDDRLYWERDGRDWPLREASEFIVAGGLRWHVQRLGEGPVALLIHGTGASTHTWRDLAPLLATRMRVVAVDLPGHAFSEPLPPGRQSLPGMADTLVALLRVLGESVDVAVGHSAGAAVLLRMALDRAIAPRAVVSVNGALLPLHGLAGVLFPPAAKLIASSSLVPRLFAWRAGDPAAVRRLVAGTGSVLDDRGVALYGRLVRSPAHAAAALAMMANWDLLPLERALPTLATPLHLVVAANDQAVPPSQAERVRRLVGRAAPVRITRLEGLGHLAHEERPADVAALISAELATAPTPPPASSPRC